MWALVSALPYFFLEKRSDKRKYDELAAIRLGRTRDNILGT
jgi:hypothetical protein